MRNFFLYRKQFPENIKMNLHTTRFIASGAINFTGARRGVALCGKAGNEKYFVKYTERASIAIEPL